MFDDLNNLNVTKMQKREKGISKNKNNRKGAKPFYPYIGELDNCEMKFGRGCKMWV